MITQRVTYIFLGLVLLLGLGLRLTGFQFGLPEYPDVDEPFVVEPAFRIAHGILNPGSFGLPDSTLFYGLGAVFAIVERTAPSMFVEPSAGGLIPLYEANRHVYITIARVVIALMGTLSVLLTFVLGRRLFTEKVGLAGALLLAIAPLSVQYAHYVRPDVALTFFVLLFLLPCVEILRHKKRKSVPWNLYVAAGVSLGIAVATKYPAFFFVPILFYVHGASDQFRFVPKTAKRLWEWISPVLVSGGASFVAFLVSTPFLLPNFNQFLEQLGYEARQEHLGSDGLSFFGNLWFYLSDALLWGFGTLAFALALFFFVVVVWRKRKRGGFLLVGVLSFLLPLSFLSLHWARWLLPILPLLALATAAGVRELWWKTRRRSERVLLAAALCIVILAPLTRSGAILVTFLRPDTRDVAEEWIQEHVPKDVVVRAEDYTPPLRGFENVIQEHSAVQNFEEGWVVPIYGRDKVRYVILSDAVYGRLTQHRDRRPYEAARYDELLSHSEVVYTTGRSNIVPVEQFDALYTDDLTWLGNAAEYLVFRDFNAHRGPGITVLKMYAY